MIDARLMEQGGFAGSWRYPVNARGIPPSSGGERGFTILLVLAAILFLTIFMQIELGIIETAHRVDKHRYEMQQKSLMSQSGIVQAKAKIDENPALRNDAWTATWSVSGQSGGRSLILSVTIEDEVLIRKITSKAYFADEGEGGAYVQYAGIP